MSTWKALIDLSLLEIGVLEAGEAGNESQRERGFVRLHGMLDLWSIDGLLAPTPISIDHTFTQSKQTLSVGKDDAEVDAEQPSRVYSVDYETIRQQGDCSGYRLTEISHNHWLDVSCTTPGAWPARFYFQNSWPNAVFYFDTPPAIGDKITIRGRGYLLSPTVSLDDEVNLPRGYEECALLSLAILLSGSYGVTPKESTVVGAMESYKVLQKRNIETPVCRSDAGMMGHNQRGVSNFNIRSV